MVCKCSSLPQVVDLTEAFFADDLELIGALPVEPLISNLREFGWSPLKLRVDDRRNVHFELLSQQVHWKRHLLRLFEGSFLDAMRKENRHGGMVPDSVEWRFYDSESGAAGAVAVEAKQSWELKGRASAHRTLIPLKEATLDTESLACLASNWMHLLHTLASTVGTLLDLPPGLLLQEGDTECDSSIDLMRAFYYNEVADQNSTGSSEHTDWGSFTVIWQDDVGGLQIRCPRCQDWVPVPPSTLQENVVPFIIHVGDVTSLAISHALRPKQQIQASNAGFISPVAVPWPSPRHRVLSPTGSSRVSLVYFAYPPPNRSIEQIASALERWPRLPPPTLDGIPYDDYFVLRDQAAARHFHVSAAQRFSTILSQPLGSVFDEKWQQVQRR